MSRVRINGKVYDTTIDEHGVRRFPTNKLLRHLVDSGKVDLNDLAVAYHRDEFDPVEYMEFNMDLGYSVSGLCEFHVFFGDTHSSFCPGLGWTVEEVEQ